MTPDTMIPVEALHCPLAADRNQGLKPYLRQTLLQIEQTQRIIKLSTLSSKAAREAINNSQPSGTGGGPTHRSVKRDTFCPIGEMSQEVFNGWRSFRVHGVLDETPRSADFLSGNTGD
jgi:hypothetical protein